MKVGKNQLLVLCALNKHHGWHPGCGWAWNNYSGTVKILDSLVARDMAAVDGKKYTITTQGKEFLAGNSAASSDKIKRILSDETNN